MALVAWEMVPVRRVELATVDLDLLLYAMDTFTRHRCRGVPTLRLGCNAGLFNGTNGCCGLSFSECVGQADC